MRRVSLLVVCLAIAVPSCRAFADDDAEGCKDSPLITRMPGSTIHSCEKKEFDQKDIIVGQKDGDDQNAAQYPLDTWEQIQKYSKFDPTPGAMSLEKLTQSTHTPGMNVLMGDASVRLVAASVTTATWSAAVTPNNQDVVGPDW